MIEPNQEQQVEAQRISSKQATYYSLIEKVGASGKYQRNVFFIFYFGWTLVALTAMQTAFLFKNSQFECVSNSFLVENQNCQKSICLLPQKQRNEFMEASTDQKAVSLPLQYGPYQCEDIYIVNYMKSSESTGALFGFFLFMYITDNFGRKFSLVLVWFVAFIGTLLLSAAQNIWMACLGLFLAGVGVKPFLRISLAVFVQTMSQKKRQKYSSIINISYGFAGILIAGSYYFIAKWRLINIFFICIPVFVLWLLIYFYIEQTPRYLILKNEDNDYICKRLNRIQKINCQVTQQQKYANPIVPQDIEDVRIYQKNQLKVTMSKTNRKYNILYLVKYKSLRTITPFATLVMLVLSYLYISPSLVVDKWGLNSYTSMIVISVSELVAYPLSMILVNKLPRVKTGVFCFALCAALSVVMILNSKPYDCNNKCYQAFIQLVCVFIQRILISFYYSIFIIFNNQLFPTCIRTIATGAISAFAALGGIFGSPIVGYFYNNDINPQIFNLILSGLGIGALMFLRETHGDKRQNEQIEELKRSFQQAQSQNSSTKMLAPTTIAYQSLITTQDAQLKRNSLNKSSSKNTQ